MIAAMVYLREIWILFDSYRKSFLAAGLKGGPFLKTINDKMARITVI